jgi:Zn-dependent metalloprotease
MKKVYYSIALLLCVSSSFAQKIDTVEVHRNEKGQISFAKIRDNDSTGPKMENAVPFLKQTLRVKADDEFRSIKEERDNLGFTHQRYQQYYKGIKVEGATYLVHAKDDNIKTINGEYASVDLNSIIPSIDVSTAVENALKTVNAKKYVWSTSKDPSYPKGELVLSKSFANNKDWLLAWKVTISAIEPLISENIFVDAKTGEVVNRISLICHTNTPAIADTRYNGTKNITTDSYSGSYRLREVRNGVNIQTMNFNHYTDANNTSVATEFTDADNNWTNSEYNNINRDNAALDAHWGAEVVLDYWKNIHNRNSLNNSGIDIKNYVHYGTNYTNAFWNSTTNSMYYGDGDFIFNALTPLDICAHELGHGVCQFTANLQYQGESGALNEGFSDIWGATIEYYGDPTKQRWQIGEDLGITLRYMNNPNIMAQPDTYGGTYWYSQSGCSPVYGNDYCGVHTNSGVLNYWYYLLVEGGSGTNDISNSFNVFGIGLNDAAKIAYRAEAYYLNSTADYAAARTATLNAAKDLFGETSCQYISVMNAWYAVGVGAAWSGTTINPYINGANAFCSGSQSYTITGGTSYTWNLSGSAASYTTSGNTATLTATSNGAVTLTASVDNACGTSNTGYSTKAIYIGSPITGPGLARVGHPTLCGWQILTNVPAGVTFAQETTDGGVTWFNKGFTPNPYLPSNLQLVYTSFIQGPASPIVATLRYGNGCGFGPSYTSTVTIPKRNCGGGGGGVSTNAIDSLTTAGLLDESGKENFITYPNPSLNGQITIAAKANTTFNKVFVYDQIGVLVKSFDYKNEQSKVTLNLSALKPGTYHVRITNGTASEMKKIIIQH